jgi:hypothetical protein
MVVHGGRSDIYRRLGFLKRFLLIESEKAKMKSKIANMKEKKIAKKKHEETDLTEEVIKKYNTAEIIEFLREQDLDLSETALKILEDEEVNGRSFFILTEEKLHRYGMKGGPASVIADFAKKCKKLRSFSSYRTKKDLKEVLEKYGVENGRIIDISQFTPSNIFRFLN